MNTRIAIFLAVVLALSGACKGPVSGRKATARRTPRREHVLLTVDFEPMQTLTYRFVSSRDITLDWDPGASASEGRVQQQSERLEMVVVYTPIEVDPYGVSTIRAVCQSVQVMRSGQASGRGAYTDAVTTAQGKTFTLKVDPRGKIVDASDLDRLIRELGVAAFRPDTSRGRIKEPDLIGDFIAPQWFLWDAISSIDTPTAGVSVGQSWPSTLSVPTPMVMRKARDVTYRLAEVRNTEQGRVAVIDSTYRLARSVPSGWPVPYSGRFQLSGTFGFLGAYDIVALKGIGRTLFNVDAGRLDREDQKYTLQMKALLPPLGIRANPFITIEQTLTTELLDDRE
ncbi:MAG: hypothetical protein JW993_17765 [Sedimentisphaerales bacterium]|nr:hypothetical protein [Sedimentisphaerales bacterium]